MSILYHVSLLDNDRTSACIVTND